MLTEYNMARWLCVLLTGLLAACGGEPEPAPGMPAVPAPAPAVAAPEPALEALPEGFRLTSFKWDGPMRAGDALRVRNPYGDIRCRKSGTGELIVSAQIQTFTEWQPAPKLEVVEDNGRFELEIDHPQPVRAEFGGDYQQGFAGRIDITVLLPPDTAAELETRDGALRVKNFIGELEARTHSGELYYKSAGRFQLETNTGAVTATISDLAGETKSEIRTGSGPVTVALAAGSSASIDVQSAGNINFTPAEGVKAGKEHSPGRMVIHLSGGGTPLKISSKTGDVTIRAD